MFRRVRLRYQAISFGVVWTLALILVALLPRLIDGSAGVAIAASIPFALLLLFFAGAAGALYFFVRTLR